MQNKETEATTEKGWLGPVAAIWSAYAITCFVAIATIYSMGWHVTSTTGDPMAIAAVTVCGLLPQGLLAPFGGVVADHFNRKSILLACYVVIAVAALATAGAVWAGHLSLPVILTFALVMGVRNGFRDPAFNALMPMLVPERHLIRINMLDNLLSAASMILAPALGILLYSTFGLGAPMLALAAGSVLSMLTLATVSVPTVRNEAEARLRDEFVGGFKAIAGHRGMFVLVLVFVVGLMAYGPFDDLMPLLVSAIFGGDGYAASICTGTFGMGLLAGSAAIMAVGERIRLSRVIAGCAVALGALILACGLMPSTLLPCSPSARGCQAPAAQDSRAQQPRSCRRTVIPSASGASWASSTPPWLWACPSARPSVERLPPSRACSYSSRRMACSCWQSV